MAVEIEVKMPIGSHDVVRARLREVGATPIGRFLETNTFLDTEDRVLLAGDEGLRIRANRDLGTGRTEHVVTYKGPRQTGAFKSREEVEVAVDDGAAAVTLMERLGYLTMIEFEKRRESYRLDDCRVELDEMPHLGTFVEIEGPSEEAVAKVRGRLRLADVPQQKLSYVAMLIAHLRQHNDPRRRVTF